MQWHHQGYLGTHGTALVWGFRALAAGVWPACRLAMAPGEAEKRSALSVGRRFGGPPAPPALQELRADENTGQPRLWPCRGTRPSCPTRAERGVVTGASACTVTDRIEAAGGLRCHLPCLPVSLARTWPVYIERPGSMNHQHAARAGSQNNRPPLRSMGVFGLCAREQVRMQWRTLVQV